MLKLTVKDGTFGYRKDEKILDHISFEACAGEIVMILGKNGVGKTTLLKCICGLQKWDYGKICLDGEWEKKSLFQQISYVAQSYECSFSYRVIDMVCMGLTKKMGYFSTPGEKEKKQALQIMREIGIEELADMECSALSGGQFRMVMIARALVSDPYILVMDEAETHLDIRRQRDLLKLIKKLTKERGIICLFNTHYPEHALKYADQVLFLGKKRYLYGKTEEVMTEENLKEFLDVKTCLVDLKVFGYREKMIYITD